MKLNVNFLQIVPTGRKVSKQKLFYNRPLCCLLRAVLTGLVEVAGRG